MNTTVKEFLEKNVDWIDKDYNKFWILAASSLVTHDLAQLADVLESIDLHTVDTRWAVFRNEIANYVDYHQNQKPGYARDRSNSWARLDYMLEDISDMGFGWHEAKQYVIDHAKRLGLVLTALEPQYGWQGDGDYAFQWFDKDAFDLEYGDDYQ